MMTSLIRNAVFAGVVASAALFGTGCYVEADPPVYAENGVQYSPQYYDGYMVYYDDYGRPFYYNNGAVVWVPASSPYYSTYVANWRYYGPAYRGWYSRYGYRYRGWRAPARRWR